MKHILVVDDVINDLKCAEEILRDIYQVTTVDTGEKALLFLEENMPDLILLDVDMPAMNGYEVMEQLKQDEVFSGIPVVFFIEGSDRENEIRCLKMGAMDFIKKPFEPELMLSRIGRILKLTEQNKILQDIARKDGLTDLLNRRYMEKLLNQTDNREEKGFFLLLDLDNFKLVNDTFGHVVGDEVLVRFAGVLKEEVDKEGCVCRLGGDEFAIYIPKDYKKETLKKIVRRMIAVIEFEVNELLSESCGFKVSVSIGIAEKPGDGRSFMELYSAADKALYYVKQNGKRGFHFYGDSQKDIEESEKENKLINLIQLQRLIQEKGCGAGAYKVEYDGFKRIYHFISRCKDRKSQDLQLLLFTVKDTSDNEIGNEKADKGIRILEEAVVQSLRKEDVATKCGNIQYVAILVNASYQNGTIVAHRIQQKFDELLKDDTMTLVYEMQSV
ncbi:diguanylate cyclase (GGDEF) domain-containing protein [Lachnospiraceae bacterium 10-1]|nr:diguanylate cyclase (GGDEF) domain-containing protein [Lachnospiraceae bacterium 10-1]